MDGENASQPSRRSPFTWIPAVVVAALLAATGFFVSLRYEPPPVIPAEAPVSIFSAERAFNRLQRLLPDGQPHPLGSPANRRFRAGLLRELEDLGLDPEEGGVVIHDPQKFDKELRSARSKIAFLDINEHKLLELYGTDRWSCFAMLKKNNKIIKIIQW